MYEPEVRDYQTVGRNYEVLLPIGYTDEEGITHRQASLRKMTGNEEALLYDPILGNSQLVTELLCRCLIHLGSVQPVYADIVRKMYTIDRNYLMVELRRITLGDQLLVTYTCPHCNTSLALQDNLGQLPVKRLADGKKLTNISVELKDGHLDQNGKVHKTVTLRYPTGADEEFVTPMLEKDLIQAQDAFLLRCITSFGDLSKAALEAYGIKILRDLSMGDRQQLHSALNEHSPGVDFHRTFQCENCHNTIDTALDVTHFFALS